jgi:hypothetical protein
VQSKNISSEKIEVKDYKTFQLYQESELLKLKRRPLTIDTGAVLEKLKKIGIEFPQGRIWGQSNDRTKTAYISLDRKGIAVIDGRARVFEILNPNGDVLRKIPFAKYPKGIIAFSESRLFDLGGAFEDQLRGFYIYDNSGKFVKYVNDSGNVSRYKVSNNQKYIAVQSGLPDTGDFVILYDMNGNELWRQKTSIGEYPDLQFSLDDKYLLVKMPRYWTNNTGEPESQKLYLFNVNTGAVISEEHY